MDGVLAGLIDRLMTGGPEAIIAALIFLVIGLLWERARLLADIRRREEKLDGIVDDYHKGNLTIAEAMNSLKVVLTEIKAKIT